MTIKEIGRVVIDHGADSTAQFFIDKEVLREQLKKNNIDVTDEQLDEALKSNRLKVRGDISKFLDFDN